MTSCRLPSPAPGPPPAGSLAWFRRDLRDADHAALAAALSDGGRSTRRSRSTARSSTRCRPATIGASISSTAASSSSTRLCARGGGLIVRHDRACDATPALARALLVAAAHANRDDEPDAIARDAAIAESLGADGMRRVSCLRRSSRRRAS